MVIGSALITSETGAVRGSFPAAIPRTTMSRSVTMPTSEPSRTTGIDPQSSWRMSVAAWASTSSGRQETGSAVIRSRTFMAHLRPRRSEQDLRHCADLEDLRSADRAGALRRGPPVLHRDLLRVLDLARGLAFHAVASRHKRTSR